MNQEQPIGSDQQGLVSARRRSAARWELKSRVALTLMVNGIMQKHKDVVTYLGRYIILRSVAKSVAVSEERI